MTATLSKLPTVTRPIKMEPNMAAAIERRLAPLSGKRLERAQDAVRKVYGSGFQGSFSQLLEKYEAAIDAVAKEKEF
jgi:hypothetical protein